jgi:hypothetical protein
MLPTLIVPICALVVAATLRPQLEAIAKVPGEPSAVSAAGITKAEDPILTIENASAFDPGATKRRLVMVGEGEAAPEAVLEAVRWLKTTAPAAIRRQWLVSAMPEVASDPTDALSLSRWVTFQAPDLVVEVGVGGAVHLEGVPTERVSATGTIAALQRLLGAATRSGSPLRATIGARIRRTPLEIARLLAKRYPEVPSISYIPSVSWVNTLRLGTMNGDASLKQKVLGQTAPWMSGEKKLFGDRIQLTAVAGAMVFAELSKMDGGGAAETLAREAAALAAAIKPDGIAQYGQGWTDDMFMASSILSRTGNVDAAAKLLRSYAARLQRPDGLFNHAVDGPAAWGRGNGFAALGLIEALTAMPDQHPSRTALLEIYRRHMAAVKTQQSPDGMWREVIDDPAAYREETATAMLLTAMTRGVRRGWIDRSYAPVIQRAWRALAAHIVADGTVIDVCTNTGGGPTRRYYFDRQAISGPDDRGGAMALMASVEMMEWSAGR